MGTLKSNFSIHNSVKRSETKCSYQKTIVVDPHYFQCESGSSDPAFYLNADPDPGSQTDADPDTVQTLPSKKFNFYIKNVLYVGIRLGHKILLLLGINAYSMD